MMFTRPNSLLPQSFYLMTRSVHIYFDILRKKISGIASGRTCFHSSSLHSRSPFDKFRVLKGLYNTLKQMFIIPLFKKDRNKSVERLDGNCICSC